jgi:hypothetical protein
MSVFMSVFMHARVRLTLVMALWLPAAGAQVQEVIAEQITLFTSSASSALETQVRQ